MANMKLSPPRARERALFLYRNALERGDFEAVAAILKLAERDPLLWEMIDDLAELDEGALERPSALPTRPPRSDKHITQNVTVCVSSPNGQTPKPDHSQEENDMYEQSIETFFAEHPKTLYPFAIRFITLAAALFIVIVIGGLLIEMVNDPIDGYPAVALQTEEPKCINDTASDPAAEASRLGNEAENVLDKQRRDGAELAALLAICGLRNGYSMEADAALQRSLNIFGAVPTFPDHDWGYNTTVFSPDGESLLVGGSLETALWDIASGTKLQTFAYERASGNRINPVAFSPDGKLILTYHQVGIARLWDANTGEVVRDLNVGDASDEIAPAVTSMAFSPDGAHALLGIMGGQVQEWDVNAGTMERAFQAGSGNVASVTYSPDGQAILTDIQRESAARLWDSETGERIRSFSGHVGLGVNSAALSADGHFVLTAGEDGTAILHDTETGDQIYSFTGFETDVNVVAFSPDGKYALVGSADVTARLYDLETGAEIRRFALNDTFVASAAFSPDGSSVLIGSVEGRVRLWPATIEDTIALACSKMTRDFTPEERAQYSLGEGATCPQ